MDEHLQKADWYWEMAQKQMTVKGGFPHRQETQPKLLNIRFIKDEKILVFTHH